MASKVSAATHVGYPLVHCPWRLYSPMASAVQEIEFDRRREGTYALEIALCHFGVPDWMGDFQNPELPMLFAEYAGAVAERYPWVRGYTPVNEIYVASRNSGFDGRWNECLRSDQGFITAMKHMVAANLLASAAIVRYRPNAIIFQSESAEYVHHVTANPFFVSPNGAASNQIQYDFIGELPSPTTRGSSGS